MLMLMYDRTLPVTVPALPRRLVQEHDAERGDEVHPYAYIHRKGAVDE